MLTNKNIKIDIDRIRIKTKSNMVVEIPYENFTSIKIIKDSYAKNWLIGLIIGISLLTISGLTLFDFISNFEYTYEISGAASPRSAMTYYVSIFILFIAGLWFIITVIKRDYYLILNTKNKKYKISIGDLIKNGEIKNVIDTLKKKIIAFDFEIIKSTVHNTV